MKFLIVIMDGAAGWPLAELGGRTTLEAARTPRLDALARDGLVGLARTVPAGAEPSSSAACMSILGYDPVRFFIGRGAIEAASMGIELAEDEVALRLNLVTIEGGVMRSYSAGQISTEESRPIVLSLADALDDATFRVHPGIAYRHILVVRGHPELLECRYTPPHDISGKPVAGHLPRGPGAELLLDYMERARGVLAEIAPNVCRASSGEPIATDVWPFWPGTRPSGLPPFAQRTGLKAALTSGVDLLNGIAVLSGIDRLEIAGVTSGSDTDYGAQIEGALGALADHDLVVVHIEAPDEEGHAGDIDGKVRAIEAIDAEVIARVHDGEDLRVLAMPDHPTPIALKTHVGEPVPFVLWGPGIGSNGASAFSERAAEATGLLVDPGHELLDRLLLAGR